MSTLKAIPNCICRMCRKEFHQKPSRIKIGKGKFCSKNCRKISGYSPFWLGIKNPRWNGGKSISSHGYTLIESKNHPNSDKRGYIFEHRLTMEKHLGRRLTNSEVVHHKNHQRSDNNIDNLLLFPNHSEHVKYEKFQDKCVNFMNKGINFLEG